MFKLYKEYIKRKKIRKIKESYAYLFSLIPDCSWDQYLELKKSEKKEIGKINAVSIDEIIPNTQGERLLMIADRFELKKI